MAKPIIQLSTYELTNLKKKVELEFGIKIQSKNDCLLLSEEIKSRTKEIISQSTIYRLFFQADKHRPYQHTLDTIAHYCGYASILSLINDIRKDSKISASLGKDVNQVDLENSLLFQCVRNQEFKSLQGYLDNIENNISIENKGVIGFTIYHALKLNPQSEMAFYKRFHSHPVIRECFFELMADPNFELNHYEKGIELYLSDCNDLSDLKLLESFIFGHCMLARHLYITHNQELFLQKFDLLLSTRNQYFDTFENIHLFPKLRFSSLQIFAYFLREKHSELNDFVLHLIYDVHQSHNNWSILEKRIACYSILESLILIDYNEQTIRHFLKPFENDFHFKMKNLNFHQILDGIQPNGLLYRNFLTT